MPPEPRAVRSAYAKAPAGGFDLASAAVALDLADGCAASARVALGGLAHRPWRSREAEDTLVGHVPDSTAFADAADAALAGARPLSANAFKVPLARAVLIEALVATAKAPAA